MRLEEIDPNLEILGAPDKEYFPDLGDGKRERLYRQLGLIWDYTPSLWDEYTSIDDYFETMEHKLNMYPDYRRKITVRAMHIQEILGR